MVVGENAFGTVLFAFTWVVLLATSVPLIRGLRRCQPWSQLLKVIALTSRAVRLWNETENDEVSLLVQAKLRHSKLNDFREVSQWLTLGITPMTLTMQYNVVQNADRLYTPTQDVVQILMHCILAWVICRPDSVSWRTMRAIYGVGVAGAVVFVSPWSLKQGRALQDEVWATQVFIVNAAIIALNSSLRSLPAIIPGSLLVTIATSFSVISNGGVVPLRAILVLVLAVLHVCFCIRAHSIEMSLKDSTYKGLEMQEATELILAASALLRSCCDVVVELNSEGVILSPGHDLANFLLRGPANRFQNSRLVDVIAQEEDKAKFLRKLFSPTVSGSEMAEATHVHMRDGNNNNIRTQVLWFRYRHMDGRPRYMVGIREFSDAVTIGSVPQLRRTTAASGEEEEDDDSESLGRSSSISETSPAVEATLDERSAVLTVDLTSPGMLVQSCSQAFCMRVGRLAPGTPLQQFLQHADDFEIWLQDSVNKVAVGDDHQHHRLALNMRQGRVRATCKVWAPASRGAEEAPLDLEGVHLIFTNVELRLGHGRRARAAGPGARGPLQGTPALHMAL